MKFYVCLHTIMKLEKKQQCRNSVNFAMLILGLNVILIPPSPIIDLALLQYSSIERTIMVSKMTIFWQKQFTVCKKEFLKNKYTYFQ